MSSLPLRSWLLAVSVCAATVMAGGAAAAVDGGSAACTRPATSGDTTVDVAFDGTTYPVLVHVPAGVRRTRSLPLVLNLHGSSSNGPRQMDISGLRAVAAQERFVVAAPSGAIPLAPGTPPDPDGSWAWNVPDVPTTAGAFPPADARNDVRFLTRVIDVLSSTLCTDPSRTYSTGYSGGGRMTSALACRAADRIAAIAPVAGLRAGRPDPDDVSVPEVEDCRPSRPVPVVTFHGQQDTVNPYPGNPDLRWGYAVPVGAATWARLNDCRRGPQASTISEHVTRLSYSRCAQGAEVQLYRVSNGGHTWPGTSVPAPGLGLVTQEINAATIMWDFFEDHRLRR
jgi:polyhydroxybutyrate depolymerase